MQGTLQNIQETYWNQMYDRWLSIEIGSFGWFFNIVFLLVVYIIWIRIVDKRRIKELLLFGALISVFAGFIDLVAISTGLWEYKIRLVPINPATFPFDYTIVPIMSMTALQFTSSKRGYFLAATAISAIFSFIISPIYNALGIKEYHNFSYFYMFVLVLSVTTMTKYIYDWISSVQKRNSLN